MACLRFSSWVWPAVGLFLLASCGGGGSTPKPPDGGDTSPADGDAGGGEPDGATPPIDAGTPAQDAAVTCLTGCDEADAECGEIDDGCGGTIACGDPCERPSYCGGDPELGPNRCGCKPKTCEDLGARCGADLDDGCGGRIPSCGTCPGAQDVCTEAFSCLCAPDLSACAGKACGTANDGCSDVPCGPSEGACSVGDCAADQSACLCPEKAEACAGQEGTLTLPNGCSYDCDAGCVPDDVAACAGATCGTARNNCGETVSCGTCGAGEACVDTQYVTGTEAPRVCLANDVVNLIGSYGVRTHAFRRAGAGAATVSNSRAEALSLVTITSTASGLLTLRDAGCAATTKNFPNTIPATSRATAYAGIAPVELALQVAGGTWTRPIAGGGQGVPTGFSPTMPSYCVGHAGQDVDLPAGDTRSWFTDGPDTGTRADCRCPSVVDTLPASSPGASNEDCRISDADGDGKPGFTVQASVPLGGATAYNVSIAEITWKGEIVASGHHTGIAIEPAPIRRSTVGCVASGLLGGTVCAGLAGTGAESFDCACGEEGEHNFVQFAPLDGVADPGANGWSCADVSAQATALFASFGSCSTSAECPDHALCNAGRCWPATTAGACGASVACPAQMACESDRACWPVSGQCPSPGDSSSDDCTYTVPP